MSATGESERDAAVAIRVEGLCKAYRRTTAGHKFRTLKSALVERSLVGGLRPEESIVALKDISFTVRRGEAVGLLGSNGSGKSTLLKMVASILRPTSGEIEVHGRAAALIELGAGFHPEISGRENIYINGAVLGLSRRQIDQRYDDIVAFSGLADFIEEPVKNYSSGMYVRLGFAVAIHTDPEILLVDEVLSVGDESFAHRCLRRIEEFLAGGGTLLLVSHSLSLIEQICDRAVWLDKGEMRLVGHPRRVIDAYRAAVAEDEGRAHREAKEERERQLEEAAAPPEESAGPAAVDANGDPEPEKEGGDSPVLRWGSGEATVERVRLLAADGQNGRSERYHFETGETVIFDVEIEVRRELEDFVFGVAFSTPRGVEVWGTNTDLEGFSPARLRAGGRRVELKCPDLRLAPGEYLVDVAIHTKDGTPYDYRRRFLSFTMTSSHSGVGIYFPHRRWAFSDGVEWRDDADHPGIAPEKES